MLSISANPVSESNFFSGLAKKKSSPIFKYKLKTTIRSSFPNERFPFRCGNWFRNTGLNFPAWFSVSGNSISKNNLFSSLCSIKPNQSGFFFVGFGKYFPIQVWFFFKAKLIFPIFQIQESQNHFF
jgi:hypothetical protein